MLSLLDPVEIDDLVVFRDDEDPRKFYLLPDQPVIPLDDLGSPEFLFIKYMDIAEAPEGTDVTGGWVQFRSALTVAADRRQKVVTALTARLEEEKAAGRQPFGKTIDATDPLLAAPLWIDGKVALATFQASPTGLVRHSTDSAPADLAGSLGASFGLELAPDGAEIFWGAFKSWAEQQLPILITYQLTYTARVSASMTVHAKQQVIHHRLWQVARPYRLLTTSYTRYVPVPFEGAMSLTRMSALRASMVEPIVAMLPRLDLDLAIQQTLVDKSIDIEIHTDQLGSGDEAAKVQDLLFKLATTVLSDHIIPAFFGDGSTQPAADSASDPQAGHQLLTLSEQVPPVDSSFTLELTEQSTVNRTVNPNGPIHLLLGSPQALASCFRELRLTDGFFSAMKVSAQTAGVKFADDGIDTIHVFFNYEQQDESNPDRPWVRRATDGVLHSETDVLYWRFDTARDAGGGHKREYQMRMDVFYKGGPPTSTGWVPRSDRMLQITPRTMGALRVELALTAGRDAVTSARVELSHQAASGTVFQTAIELTPDANRQSWFQYTGALASGAADDLTPPTYSYVVRYRTGGGEIVLPPAQSSAKTLEIPTPFKKALTFTLRPQGSFEGLSSVSGDIVYDDPAHQYRVRRSFQLQKLTDSLDFTVPVLDGGPETASWTARLVRVDGSVEELSPGHGPAGTLWVGPDVDLSMTVQVRSDLLDLDADVQLAVVELSYNDPAHGVEERETFTFSKSARGPQTWRVARSDRNLDRYDADIRYIAYDRTKSSVVHLTQIDDQVLLLDRAAAPHP